MMIEEHQWLKKTLKRKTIPKYNNKIKNKSPIPKLSNLVKKKAKQDPHHLQNLILRHLEKMNRIHQLRSKNKMMRKREAEFKVSQVLEVEEAEEVKQAKRVKLVKKVNKKLNKHKK